MKLQVQAGVTSQIWQVWIADSSSTTGAGLTGLTNASGGLTAYYHGDTDTTATAVSLVSMTVGTYTSGGFKEIDAANMPGWYQFCPPDAAIGAGAESVAFHLTGAANMAPLPIEVQLVGFDPQDGTRLGLTALPNAAADAAGGLPVIGTTANRFKSDSAANVTVTQAFPTNFATMAIDGSGHLTLAQAFPTNFATLAIDGSGSVFAEVDAIADGTISDDTFVTPPETIGVPTTILAMQRRMYEVLQNGETRNRTSLLWELFGADGFTVLCGRQEATTVVGPDTIDSVTGAI